MGKASTGTKVRGPATGEDQAHILSALIQAEALCAGRGQRLNDSGRRVLKALLAAGAPLKAYDLTYALAKAGRSAGPPTVYRALKFLVDMGLAHRIESLSAYVACRFLGEPHVAGFRVCERCGAAEEFRLDDVPPQAAPLDPGRLVFEVLKVCATCATATPRDVR
jgi:Fur family zinc uptake transcriptional regulator